MNRRVFPLLAATMLVAGIWWYRLLPAGVPLSGEWGDEAARNGAAAIVRAAFAGTPAPAATKLPAERGRRVFVTAHGRGWSDRATAHESSTAASLETAGRALGESVAKIVAAGKRAPEWIVVDVVAATQSLGNDPDHGDLEILYETGVDGLIVEADGKMAAVTPGDPITEGWFSPRVADPKGGGPKWYTRGDEGMRAKDTARTRLAQAIGGRPDPAKTQWTRFRTDSFLVRTGSEEPPIPLYRGMPVGPVIPDSKEIHASSLAGGEWLVAQLGSDGMFQYTYVPNRDQDTPPGSYSFIRHTATAWMMVRLGHRFERPEWVAAGRRALVWAEQWIVPAPLPHGGRADRSMRRSIVASPRESKGGLGHNSVTVIALLEEPDLLTPEQHEKVKGIGVSLEMMLRCESATPENPCVGGDGGFFESESENMGRPKNKKDSLLYEPGEGLLALVTLAEAYPDEKHWMESALVSARYHSSIFMNMKPNYFFHPKLWKQMTVADQLHWKTMAFEKLAKVTKDPQWAKVAVAMGEAVLATGSPPMNAAMSADLKPIGPVPWDYSGSFPLNGRIPRTTPTGSRAEAINAARRSAIMLGRSPDKFEAMLKRTAGFQLRNQFTEASCYFCPRPEKALGAFRAGMTDNEIRIDFIQHVIAGQADTLEWLDPSIGKPLHGEPKPFASN